MILLLLPWSHDLSEKGVRYGSGNFVHDVVVGFDGDSALCEAAQEHRDYIMKETLATTFERDEWLERDVVETEIDGKVFRFRVTKSTYG